MSFMFNPHPYEEPTAVNRPPVSDEVKNAIVKGVAAIADKISEEVIAANARVILVDGYPSVEFEPFVNQLAGKLKFAGCKVNTVCVADAYRSAEELEAQFADHLPTDREKDPVLLFGRRFEGGFAGIFDVEKENEMLLSVENASEKVIVFGHGSTHSEAWRALADKIVYMDVIPKEAVLRAKSGRMKNIGDKVARPFKEMMRRAYYVDFDISLLHRRTLLKNGLYDYYIDSTAEYKMMPKKELTELLDTLAKMPFRPSPVYLEGVWGGQSIKTQRNVPDCMKNIAWIFDFIPMEVSLKILLGDESFLIPFYSFLQSEEESIMGKACVEAFDGFFPIRFNYDDTVHSSGNMSIQVHSGADYNRKNYGEFGRQDESYYVIEAGHNAKTYLGFENDIDPDEFIAKAKESEKEHTVIDYKKYIHAVDSIPGTQVMIPAGTIHASGQNQLILEIGSLTVGSYTYKMYDYLRLDLDGNPRPIHTYHGERVLAKERNADWIHANVVQTPRIIREGDGWCEKILGEHDLLYFSLRHLEFDTEIEDDTNGRFHVLSLVNGRSVRIESIDHPEYSFEQNYLDIVVIPASVGRYRVRNLTNNPVIIHKTMLKDGFENEKLY